ncbi:MAG: NAD-dependent epimerase/dehydratase family protein [Bacteroidales bacterium]|nr:NAD-dependent epimerase/dehydratase family protein [Bacteroidales bacterium]
MKTALIAGASGLVGSELLKLLIDNAGYTSVHILSRKPLETKSAKTVEHIVNFDELDKFDPEAQIDHIFCTLGTTIKKAKSKENFRKVDYDYILALGKKAKLWNADKFLMVSSLGANAKSAIFYNRVKGEIENALKQLELSHLFIFRPSLLLGNRKEQRTGEKTAINVYKVLEAIFIGPFKKYKGIEAKQVAKGMLNTALQNTDTFKILESDEIQTL